MKSASDIVLKLLGILLLTTAVLKGWQLLTEPMANKDIWTNRAFLMFTVEFELALSFWLLSGLFKKLAWLATLTCFSMFSIVTLYKGISGAESCGCFGSVHVNPWITLFAIDIPSILALAIFRQKHISEIQAELNSVPCHCKNHACQECKCQNIGYLASLANRCKYLYKKYAAPLPSLTRLVTVICTSFVILALSVCVLAFNEPVKSTSEYEVLEPETWVGKPIPILDYIDIGNQLQKGHWLILFYHHDCPKCQKVISTYKEMFKNYGQVNDSINLFFLEVPPYGKNPIIFNTKYPTGKLSDKKEWFVNTPIGVLVSNGTVIKVVK
jgi:hypothetical protein